MRKARVGAKALLYLFVPQAKMLAHGDGRSGIFKIMWPLKSRPVTLILFSEI